MLGRGEIFSIAQMAAADAAAIASRNRRARADGERRRGRRRSGQRRASCRFRRSCCAGRAITAVTASSLPGVWSGPAGRSGSPCSGAWRRLRGDAAGAAKAWSGGTVALEPAVLEGAGLVVDALFGAGLARPLDGVARATVEAVAGHGAAGRRGRRPLRDRRRYGRGARRRGAGPAHGHLPSPQARTPAAAGARIRGRAGDRRHRHSGSR